MNLPADSDEKLLYSRIDDALRQCEKHRDCVFLGFLNERQAYFAGKYLQNLHRESFMFFGGHKSALRVFLCIYYNKKRAPDFSRFPITALEFKYRKVDVLSHRDFLGAVMSLGVSRESIGDIAVFEGRAVLFADSKIADYLSNQITTVGSVGVRVSVLKENYPDFPQKFEESFISVASMRLDNITAALANLSREKTAQIILSGLVSVNYVQNQNVSHLLTVGDIISIRKKGKFVITDNSGTTKKGRIRLSVKIFK